MKKKTIELSVGIVVLGAILMFAGCMGSSPPNTEKNSNQAKSDNANSVNNQISEVDTDGTDDPRCKKIQSKIDRKLGADGTVKIGCSKDFGTIKVSGKTHGKVGLRDFDEILFEAIQSDDAGQTNETDQSMNPEIEYEKYTGRACAVGYCPKGRECVAC